MMLFIIVFMTEIFRVKQKKKWQLTWKQISKGCNCFKKKIKIIDSILKNYSKAKFSQFIKSQRRCVHKIWITSHVHQCFLIEITSPRNRRTYDQVLENGWLCQFQEACTCANVNRESGLDYFPWMEETTWSSRWFLSLFGNSNC